jgi:CHAT domain-containing protein
MRGLLVCLLVLLGVPCALPAQPNHAPEDWQSTLQQGIRYRQQGEINRSVDALKAAAAIAASAQAKAEAAGELGISLYYAGRYDEAEASLSEPYSLFAGPARARYAIELGNVAYARKQNTKAAAYYREALSLAGDDAVTRLTAQLNLARLAPAPQRPARLAELGPQIDTVGDPQARTALHLNLGAQAMRSGADGTALAYVHLDRARQLAAHSGDQRALIEALDSLARLYEDHGRPRDAMRLTERALARADALPPGSVADLLIDLESRRGRLARRAGRTEVALLAYQRAADQIEAVRQDMPIEYLNGRTSLRETLEPVYMGLVELLLDGVDGLPAAEQQARLARVRDALELLRQAEMQDYLGDRCTVDAIRGEATGAGIPLATGILYPIVLQDRIELLMETAAGFEHRRTSVSRAAVHSAADAFAEDLRNEHLRHDLQAIMPAARQLYQWLLAPLDDAFAADRIRTLVVASDGPLRLLPFGALHDGRQFVVERMAVSTVTGMSMTNRSAPRSRGIVALIAGVSEPTVDSVRRSVQAASGVLRGTELGPDDLLALQRKLALPSVPEEVKALEDILPGTAILDGAFTVDRFLQEAGSGEYRVVHLASHGYFGGSAEKAYIMAHDGILTMDGLQGALQSTTQRAPLELLSLSACQTAEGNDRAPLGIAGAAMKARARSVLGTLWPVEDTAAQRVMVAFYRGLAQEGLSKAQALQQAQTQLLDRTESAHPFFWAPFVLIGNWQ